jgi:hypothetical protein
MEPRKDLREVNVHHYVKGRRDWRDGTSDPALLRDPDYCQGQQDAAEDSARRERDEFRLRAA